MAYLVYSHIELIRIAGNFSVRMKKQDFYDDEFSLFPPGDEENILPGGRVIMTTLIQLSRFKVINVPSN